MPRPAHTGGGAAVLPRLRRVTVALLLALAVLLVAGSSQAQATVKSALFLLQVLPGTPVHPLTWVSAAPIHERVSFLNGAGWTEADVYRPPGGSHSGAVVVLGLNVDRTDPTLDQALDAMARLGIAVMVPDAGSLFAGRIDPDQPATFVHAFQYLRQQSFVRPDKVGFLGFSVGSSLAAIAAADPVIRDEVAFLHWFGGYYSATDLVAAVAGRQAVVDGKPVSWAPSTHVLLHLEEALATALAEPGDRRILSRAFVEAQEATPAEIAALSASGRRVYDLLTAATPDAARRVLNGFPAPLLATLAAVSPDTHVAGIRAPTFVLHDVQDRFIPHGESRRFWENLPPASRDTYTEVALFEHVTPERPTDRSDAAREFGKLFWYLRRLLAAML